MYTANVTQIVHIVLKTTKTNIYRAVFSGLLVFCFNPLETPWEKKCSFCFCCHLSLNSQQSCGVQCSTSRISVWPMSSGNDHQLSSMGQNHCSYPRTRNHCVVCKHAAFGRVTDYHPFLMIWPLRRKLLWPYTPLSIWGPLLPLLCYCLTRLQLRV